MIIGILGELLDVLPEEKGHQGGQERLKELDALVLVGMVVIEGLVMVIAVKRELLELRVVVDDVRVWSADPIMHHFRMQQVLKLLRIRIQHKQKHQLQSEVCYERVACLEFGL